MAISKKQLIANRENAKKGGVKSEKGKSIVKHNAVKHGLLSKEIVITSGEGAERQDEFDSLLGDLQRQFNPQGLLEAMLVEKIAVSWWRLRRVYRYETGLISEEMEKAKNPDYEQNKSYTKSISTTDVTIDDELREAQQSLSEVKKDKIQFSRMREKGRGLEEIYDQEPLWKILLKDHQGRFQNAVADRRPETIKNALNTAGFSDDDIWQAILDITDAMQSALKTKIDKLEREKASNKLRPDISIMKASIPSKDNFNHLLRYETAIERQFYKAMDQLERLQRLRAGENVPPPMKMSLDLNAENMP